MSLIESVITKKRVQNAAENMAVNSDGSLQLYVLAESSDEINAIWN